ncbi:leucyl/phenylalanyl-tRNA--protein transferase [Psychromonas sp.]|uniref:leucyl/phenylalanyl-tRNA--protein transferase n=1 Tax=Psychromonas sp. TaxID=1884585 RepID=UPI00356A48FF
MPIYLPELDINNNLFPDIASALSEPDGLLAMGGDLSTQRIISAYRKGIFPWFSTGQPILWWSPSKRAILKPDEVHISKSMKKLIKKNNFSVTINLAFNDVIHACAAPRSYQNETWITDTMIAAYNQLHQQGFAHSVEVWSENELIGGLYGICIGSLFCGESMFSKAQNSSKIAFIALCQHFASFQGLLIDCQMVTEHLQRFGVKGVSRADFSDSLNKYKNRAVDKKCWNKQSIEITTK